MVILCLEVRESQSLYVHFYIVLLFLKNFFVHCPIVHEQFSNRSIWLNNSKTDLFDSTTPKNKLAKKKNQFWINTNAVNVKKQSKKYNLKQLQKKTNKKIIQFWINTDSVNVKNKAKKKIQLTKTPKKQTNK